MTKPLASVKCLLTLTCSLTIACSAEKPHILVTIADARQHAARFIDIGEPGDSVGDLYVFDQPLLDKQEIIIGNNSGQCTRTQTGHSSQCQWTLTFPNGSIQVAGREFDKGISYIAIIGGTGAYSGISGEMKSVNNEDGTFSQTLYYRIQ